MATLIHHAPRIRPPVRFTVLYIHGWSDYFYNAEMAEFFTRAGAEFYAVDMHGVGRSLRPHQIAGYAPDLREYFTDIDAATDVIEQSHPGLPLILLSHSQGSLTAALWAKERRMPDALILNGPFLDVPYTPLLRAALTPVAKVWAHYQPTGLVPISSPRNYERTISRDLGGEWPINDEWRIDPARPAHPAWARAVLTAQNEISRGLDLPLPILTLTAHRSIIRPRWSEEMRRADVISDVRRTWRLLPRLGPDYTLIKIRDAVHDVLLSAPGVRARAYEQLGGWLRSRGFTQTPRNGRLLP